MKKALLLLLSLLLAALPVTAMAETLPPGTVQERTITVEKLWDHGTNPAKEQPASVTLSLLNGTETVASAEATARNNWAVTFTVPAYDRRGEPIDYTVSEQVPEGYAMEVLRQPAPAQAQLTGLSEKQTAASVDVYPLGQSNFVLAKKGGGYAVWTEQELTAAHKALLVEAVNQASPNGIGTLTLQNTRFGAGLPCTFGTERETVTVESTPDGKRIRFSRTKVWSLFYTGTVQFTEAQSGRIKNTFLPPEPPKPVTGSDLTVQKVDAGTKEPLPGAVFSLYLHRDASGCAIADFSTDEKGQAVISADNPALRRYLPAAGKTGTLYLKETRAPEGYTGSSTVWAVEIAAKEESSIAPKMLSHNPKPQPRRTVYTITVNGESTLTVTNDPAAQPRTAEIPVRKQVVQGGSRIPGAMTFYFDLWSESDSDGSEFAALTGCDGAFALTTGTEPGSCKVSLPGVGTAEGLLNLTLQPDASGLIYLKERAEGSAGAWQFDGRTWVYGCSEQGVRLLGYYPADSRRLVDGPTEAEFVNVFTLNDSPVNPPENPTITVRKVWADDNPFARPASVQVQLFSNGRPYGSPVTLSAANNWSYTWFNLIPGYAWSVDEVNVPAGYTRSVRFDGRAYVITNTPVIIPNPLPPKTDGVPVGAAAGALCLLLAVCGAVILRKKTDR